MRITARTLRTRAGLTGRGWLFLATGSVVTLAGALTADGYAATVRGVGDVTLQLCQGHCPVLDVAQAFPQLCEAELQAFARLLGVHVQRLATLAQGEHVCTTHIPVRPRIPEGTP